MALANVCELYRDAGFFGQPANSATSLAFVVSAVAIAADGRNGDRRRWTYALLVAAVGAGSLVQHGPNPEWQAYAHDLPLASLLAYTAADGMSDVLRRNVSPGWWLAVPVAMIPIIAAGPAASSLTQGCLAAVAIGANLLRAWRRPRLRKTLVGAMLILGVGSLVGTIGDRTSLCQPDSIVQGHALWHVVAAGALWWLAPAIGQWDGSIQATRTGLAAVHPARLDRSPAARPARSRTLLRPLRRQTG